MTDQNLHEDADFIMPDAPADETTPPEAQVVLKGGGKFISTDYSLEDGGWLCTGQWATVKEKLIGAPEVTVLFPETSILYIQFIPVGK